MKQYKTGKNTGKKVMPRACKSSKLKVLTPEPPIIQLPEKPLSPLKVTDIKSGKRLLSRIIRQYQAGEIDDKVAKTVAYLIQVMAQLIKDHETEERLNKLEEAAGITQ